MNFIWGYIRLFQGYFGLFRGIVVPAKSKTIERAKIDIIFGKINTGIQHSSRQTSYCGASLYRTIYNTRKSKKRRVDILCCWRSLFILGKFKVVDFGIDAKTFGR